MDEFTGVTMVDMVNVTIAWGRKLHYCACKYGKLCGERGGLLLRMF